MPLNPNRDAVLEQVRAIALALPETEERASHGQPTFFAAGKMFAQFRHNHHGDDRTVVIVKTGDPEEAVSLIENLPDLYSRPAYFRSGWVGINLEPADTDWDHVGDRIARSWELVAPARLLEAGGR
jgi:phosphoribosylglycinamide formyltransferase-1